MIVYLRRSTVEIGGREFPAVGGICPLHEETPGDTDCDRMLCGIYPVNPGERWSDQMFIPMENGALVQVEHMRGVPTYSICVCSVSCYEDSLDPDGPMWLPHSVALCRDHLVAERPGRRGKTGIWEWNHAEPDWTVEHIERLSTMPFIPPPGPKMRLISLAEADQIWKEHHAGHSH